MSSTQSAGRDGSRRLLIGLTGGIASGKSTVAELLASRGAVVIDADRLAREVVRPGTPGLAAIVARFGPDVLLPDGTLNRPALGRVVFADADARRDLEAIIHPAVRARARALTEATAGDAVVVQVIPLLVETGQAGDFDLVVVVDVAPGVQVERIRARDGLDDDQARARLQAQAGREERLAAADVVIDNAGPLSDLTGQVDRLWREWVLPRSGAKR